jgi:hypothetical protein
MRKSVIIGAVILCVAALYCYSQTSSTTPPDIYVKTVPIAKIYTHDLGYKVLYVKSNLQIGVIFVPMSWIGKSDGKAMMMWENTSTAYLSIFWVDSKFDHMVLHVPSNMQALVWGILETGPNTAAQFNVQEPKLEF